MQGQEPEIILHSEYTTASNPNAGQRGMLVFRSCAEKTDIKETAETDTHSQLQRGWEKEVWLN